MSQQEDRTTPYSLLRRARSALCKHRHIILLASAAALTFAVPDPGTLIGQAACANPIACENALPGNSSSEWGLPTSGSDPSIKGFTTDISVNKGATVHFKINTDAAAYRIDIYRMGFYSGLGARKAASVTPSVTLPQTQPACISDTSTGLVDCGNWVESATWQVPSTATSGIYFARLVRTDTGGASHVPFIVRDDSSQSDVLFQTSDTSWQAYNNYGGNSLYNGLPSGRAYKVSYNRPFNDDIYGGLAGALNTWVFATEYPMVRWLESNGYNVSYATGVDTDRRGSAPLLTHKAFLSVGHDEYWSATQRANVEAARNSGVNLAFFSGGEAFWKTRWETSIDGTATPYRTLVTYKETLAGARTDPLDPPTWTGSWRDPRFSIAPTLDGKPPADGGRPENGLTGNLFAVNGIEYDPMIVPAAFGRLRFWRNTSVATLASGQAATLTAGCNCVLGYEWDVEPDNGFRPAGLFDIDSTTRSVNSLLQDYGSSYAAGTATHNANVYRASSGALVFGAGTVDWSWALDGTHSIQASTPEPAIQQATVNLLADMGVQPTTLQPGLLPAAASTVTSPPTSSIGAPLANASVTAGTAVTISGTANSSPGAVVAAVEISTDGGTTWHRANGTQTWTFAWTPASAGTAQIRSRAVDDSGNLETPSAGIAVTIIAASATATPTPGPNAATFLALDTSTQGSWKGIYGQQGYWLEADGQNLPTYAAVSTTGIQTWTWAASTTDVRALQKAASATDRIAATWYDATGFVIDINETDGQWHDLRVYAVDFDLQSRSETVSVLDASSGATLDTRTLSAFQNGIYVTWTTRGHVQLRVTRTGGSNAVVSALFFDLPPTSATPSPTPTASAPTPTPTPAPPTSTPTRTPTPAPPAASSTPTPTPGVNTVSFLGQDTSTQGTWKGVYGTQGYWLEADGQSLPAYAQVSSTGQTWTWVNSTTDVRALQKAASSTDRIAATWFDGTQFVLDVNLTDGLTHRVSIYAVDFDSQSRSQTVAALDASTGLILDTRNLTAFQGGTYLTWSIKGHVQLRFTCTGGPNSVSSAIFFS